MSRAIWGKVITWSGEISLLAEDMHRIAGAVADRFCVAMERASKDTHLREDAAKGVAEEPLA